MTLTLFPRFRPIILCAVWVLFVWLSAGAWAHRVNVFAYPEGDQIKIESYFSRGGECMQCGVQALDVAGNVVASGTTDEQGRWSFRPQSQDVEKIAVFAGEGHRGEYILLPEDFPDTLTEVPLTEGDQPSEELEASPPPTLPIQIHEGPALSASEVEAIVDKVIERKLGPLRREFNKAQVNEPGIQEIISGIGYIFGLFGVAAYFLSRSNRRS